MDDQKEVYRLWCEYLKRSEAYTNFCKEWSKRCQEKPPDPHMPVPEGFEDHPMTDVYLIFGNPHRLDFSDWWEMFHPWLEYLESRKNQAVIEDYRPLEDIEMCFWLRAQFNGQEPTATQVKNYIAYGQHKFLVEDNMLLLKVDLAYNATTIKNEFEKFISSAEVKKRMKIAKSKPQLPAEMYRTHKPTGKPRLDDLKKYLDVYDMWKEKVQNRKPDDPSGWDEIMQHFEPGRTVSNESDRRLYSSYKERADRIIANVENGIFPGKY